MLGTFWVWYRTSFCLEDGVPTYSNIVKLERAQLGARVGTSKAMTLQISETQLLTPTSIYKADAGIVTGFIPAINDYVDVYYATGSEDTDNPNQWINLFNGRVAVNPFLPQMGSAVYEIQLIGNELLSSEKTIGNAIKGGASFIKNNDKDIIEKLLIAQRDTTLRSARYKIIFDESVKSKLIQNSGGVRTNSNAKISSVLQDMLKANQLQLFISNENNAETQTIKYHVTDKYYNPDYTVPFFTLNHYTCQLAPRMRTQPVKQANRFCYNAGVQTLSDIDAGGITNSSKVFYGDTFFNLSGLAGIINEEKIDNSFIDDENFVKVKSIRKGSASQVFEQNIKDIANKLGFNKVKNDIIEASIMQLRVLVDALEMPSDLLTVAGKDFWKKQPAIIDVGMRFILELENFNYKQEMLITAMDMSVDNEFVLNLEVVPMYILDAKEDLFTMPSLKSKYKAENNNTEPTALELMQYIYDNPNEPESRFQLGLLNPMQYGSLDKNASIINQTRILTIE
jgi:hypothetical protein